MKRISFLIVMVLMLGLSFGCQLNETPLDSTNSANSDEGVMVAASSDDCTTLGSGELSDSDGNVLVLGFDEWGYNYQAHLFDGFYCDAYRDADWCQDYADINLLMKWNDAWLSNQDCDGDGLLDRHYGFDSYIGSGAWLTNVQSGEYFDGQGTFCKWNYFVKIVAAPADAYQQDGIWYTAEGAEIGPVIWGEFAVLKEVDNDPCLGISGVQWVSPEHNDLWRP